MMRVYLFSNWGLGCVTDLVEINLMAPYRFLQFQDTECNVVKVGRMD
jgi:hypothetical protein